MKRKPMKSAPKDRPILLLVDTSWLEGSWDNETTNDGRKYGEGKWSVVSVPSHGCGCCSYDNPEPEAWADLPT